MVRVIGFAICQRVGGSSPIDDWAIRLMGRIINPTGNQDNG